jgi:Bacterial Ig domain/FG-GAP repeat
MPGIRLLDVRAALAALGLAGLAALAVAIATHVPLPAPSGPPAPAASAGLSRLQSLPLQAQSVISSTLGTGSRSFAARRTASGWGLSGGGVRADFRAGEPTLSLAGGNTLSLSLAGTAVPATVTARGNRVTLTRSGIREWYAAGPLGIEQGFTLAHRPAGATAQGVTLSLAVGGSLIAQAAGSNVKFVNSRGTVAARYGGLTAVDATGRHLAGALSVKDGRVLISVNDRGASYPITIDPLVQQGDKLSGSDAVPGVGGSDVGEGVALSGDGNTAIITGDTDNTSKGAAWVFTRSNGLWNQVGAKIVPPNTEEPGDSEFGSSVALSQDGSTALIGAILDNGQAGAAWVYVRSGSTYVDQKMLVGNGEIGTGEFGTSVALSANGNTALIGGPGDQGSTASSSGGAAWVFTRSGTTWGTGTKISPTVGGANNPSHFGTGVAVSSDGTIVLIGGPGDGPGTGAVVEYTGSGSSWTFQQRFLPDDETAPSGFGNAIAISADSNTAVIGDENDNNPTGGAAWVFTRSGTTWSQQGTKLVPSDASSGAFVGSSVAISGNGNTVLIGADNDSNMVGAAFLYTRSAGVWTESQKLTGAKEAGGAFFGQSVALATDGQTAMVGGPGDNSRTGAAWPFAPPAPVCSSVSATAPQGGGTTNVTLSCTLPLGASPAYSVIGGPSNGKLSAINANGQLTYTSNALFSGKDTFNFRVSDQWGISNIATAVVNVPFLPVPTCSNVTTKGKAGATKVTLTLKCTGPKGHSFTYGIVSKPGNGKLGKINQSKGTVTYSTHIGAQGTDRFVYDATNSGGSSKTATATIKLPFLRQITTPMHWDFDPTTATFSQINTMSIDRLPGGAKATISCKAKKGTCPISKHTVSVPKHRVCKGKGKKRKCKLVAPKQASVSLTRFVAGKHLSVGTKLTITMFEPAWIGKRFVFTMVKNQQPPDTVTAMAPGSSTKLCPHCSGIGQ